MSVDEVEKRKQKTKNRGNLCNLQKRNKPNSFPFFNMSKQSDGSRC